MLTLPLPGLLTKALPAAGLTATPAGSRPAGMRPTTCRLSPSTTLTSWEPWSVM